jgi:hypothetical protein
MAKRSANANGGTEFGGPLTRVAMEIGEDRDALKRIMGRLEVEVAGLLRLADLAREQPEELAHVVHDDLADLAWPGPPPGQWSAQQRPGEIAGGGGERAAGDRGRRQHREADQHAQHGVADRGAVEQRDRLVV